MMHVRRAVRAATAAVLLVGVACQFLQHTDPRFPLLYFTVDSALLAGVLAACGLVLRAPKCQAIAMARGGAAIGVVFSGLTYAVVIAPATATGTWFQPWDDLWVRTATVLMHGLGPILVIGDFVLQPVRTSRPWLVATLWCGWPVLYAVVVVALQIAGVAQVPYPFMQPAEMGGVGPVLAVGAGVALVFVLLGRMLLALSHKYRCG
jgi:hypothetical protein